MNLLVLGCGGFIGSHFLTRVLETTNWKVRGVDFGSERIGEYLPHPRFTFHQDSAYGRAMDGWVREADAVVSLAAICNPDFYNKVAVQVIEANFMQPYELARSCSRHGKWLIQFSTSEVYGRTPLEGEDALSEEHSPFLLGPVSRERWSYACAKQLLERSIYALAREEGLPFTIVRPFNFIGPGMDYLPGIDAEGLPRVMACFMSALIRKQPLKLVNGGRQKRVFTAVEDGVDSIMAILSRPERSQGCIFNVGHPGNEVSIADLARIMIRLYGKLAGPLSGDSPSVEYVTGEEFYGEGYDDSGRRYPDISLARDLLHWTPRISLEPALEKAMKSYLAHVRNLEVRFV